MKVKENVEEKFISLGKYCDVKFLLLFLKKCIKTYQTKKYPKGKQILKGTSPFQTYINKEPE